MKIAFGRSELTESQNAEVQTAVEYAHYNVATIIQLQNDKNKTGRDATAILYRRYVHSRNHPSDGDKFENGAPHTGRVFVAHKATVSGGR